MTYLKTLIALTTLALLTACAGAVNINPTIVNNGPTAETCTANPFTIGCPASQTEQAAFCRDNARITDTKTADCAATVIRLCNGNVFDKICPTAPTQQQVEAFCGDASKTPDGKTINCAPTVNRVCVENPFNMGLCFADKAYEPTRVQIRATCTNADDADTPRDALCPMIVVATCTENPFLAECLVGDAGMPDGGGAYDVARKEQITENCLGADGTGFGNVFHRACNGIMEYTDERARIINACTSGTENNPNCPPDVVMQICNSNPYNAAFCFGDIDYSTKRAEELAECRRDNGRPSCVGAAATTCTDNPFQENLCFIGTTYMGDRDTQTQNCRDDAPTASNCDNVLIAVCNANKFDAYCMGATDYIDAQRNECALATATLEQCRMVFTGNLAGCLADPFTPSCDTEPTFAKHKDSVRTSRFSYCEDLQTRDGRCIGYGNCNRALIFAPLTCGAYFNPERRVFCMIPENAFDPLCVDNGLTDEAAQLAYCKLSNTSPFTGGCDDPKFTEARVEFCNAQSSNDNCRINKYSESLTYVAVVVDPCEGLSTPECTVEITDLPNTILTTPTVKFEQDGMTETADFADGALNVTLIAPTSGPLLNPDRTDNTTINPAPFNMGDITGVTVQEGKTRIRRRGGPGSSNPDGFVDFRLLKAGAESETNRASVHAAILPTTNLGAPLKEAPMTAIWPGHFYRDSTNNPDAIDTTDFFVTFDGTTGTIGFANIAGTGIGLDMKTNAIPGIDDRRGSITTTQFVGIFDVTFGTDGVLKGKASSFSPQVDVTGLIGAEGAIGFFILSGGIGGFTATNPDGGAVPVIDCVIAHDACFVTYEDWRAFSTPNASKGDNERAILASDSSNLNIENSPTQTLVNLETAQYNSVNLGGHAADGFHYVVIDNGAFVGVADTTDLGLPLAAQPTGTWNGAFVSIEDSTGTVTTTDFSLTVTFGGAGLDAGNFGSISSGTIGSTGYTFTGEFNRYGVIFGETMNATKGNGDLTGIIGIEGAVGVFLSKAGATTPHAGGFVARHIPSE